MALQYEKAPWDRVKVFVAHGRTEVAASLVSEMPEHAFVEAEDQFILAVSCFHLKDA